MIRIITIALILLTIYNGSLFGQTKKQLYIGLQPGVTVEPFYEEGEFDLNLLPFIFEFPINSRINLRISPIANYHMGGVTNGISDLGIFTVLPIFIKEREDDNLIPHGLYLGPVVGFGRNLINNHYTTTLAVEPGYMFETKKRFTINLGIQLGASYFSYDSEPNKWVFHWGPKVTFGFWLRRNAKNSETFNQ
jgi:hypothetical protein